MYGIHYPKLTLMIFHIQTDLLESNKIMICYVSYFAFFPVFFPSHSKIDNVHSVLHFLSYSNVVLSTLWQSLTGSVPA